MAQGFSCLLLDSRFRGNDKLGWKFFLKNQTSFRIGSIEKIAPDLVIPAKAGIQDAFKLKEIFAFQYTGRIYVDSKFLIAAPFRA